MLIPVVLYAMVNQRQNNAQTLIMIVFGIPNLTNAFLKLKLEVNAE